MSTTTDQKKPEVKKVTPEENKKTIENHKKIATHLESAAKHHIEAANQHEKEKEGDGHTDNNAIVSCKNNSISTNGEETATDAESSDDLYGGIPPPVNK